MMTMKRFGGNFSLVCFYNAVSGVGICGLFFLRSRQVMANILPGYIDASYMGAPYEIVQQRVISKFIS